MPAEVEDGEGLVSGCRFAASHAAAAIAAAVRAGRCVVLLLLLCRAASRLAVGTVHGLARAVRNRPTAAAVGGHNRACAHARAVRGHFSQIKKRPSQP